MTRRAQRARNLWKRLLISVVFTGGCAAPSAIVETERMREPVEVEAMVDRAVATTGDLITYRIQVDARQDQEIEIAEAGAEIAGFRIVDIGSEEAQTRGDRVRYETWYQLRADLVGSYVLPPVEVRHRARVTDEVEADPWQTLLTSAIFVEVESVLPTDGEATDIRDLKPLREVRPSPPWLAVLAAGVGAALLAGLAWWYWRRRAGQSKTEPPIPAHERAFAALAELRQTDFHDPEAVRRFYFRLSEVVRAYVEGRFELNATDLTTEEILAELSRLDALAAHQNQVLQRFLIDTDQVKFAHRDPTDADIETVYEQALGFVEATRPVEASPAAEEKAA